jgi:hypothetical protein
VSNVKGDQFIRYRLADDSDGGPYRLEVENHSTEKGTYFDQIVLQTDHPMRPELRVFISGRLS